MHKTLRWSSSPAASTEPPVVAFPSPFLFREPKCFTLDVNPAGMLAISPTVTLFATLVPLLELSK